MNRKKKGNRFELETSKLLTKITGVRWFRVPMSGGFSTSQDTTADRFQGDVYSDDKKYSLITIECKSYKQLFFNDLFNKKSIFWEWVNQTINESPNEWLLFFKINNRGTYVVKPSKSFGVDKKIIDLLKFNNYCKERIVVFNEEEFIIKKIF